MFCKFFFVKKQGLSKKTINLHHTTAQHSYTMEIIKKIVDSQAQNLKYRQIVEAISTGINDGSIKVGELLPSVNQMSSKCGVSRDTVYKAYTQLKKLGLIDSVPTRGYFAAKPESKVFLLLDTFKAYKEVLYHSFRKALPQDISLDIRFHHYNINVFENAVKESIGRYTKYVIMNFDNRRIEKIIKKIPKEKLLLIDWNIHCRENSVSRVYQNFGKSVYQELEKYVENIKKYKKFIFLYPEFTDHPKETVEYFEKFCKAYKIDFQVLKDSKKLNVNSGELYFLVSDRTLAMFLDQCAAKKFTPGVDAGVISYNETPMKKYVENGITVISTDFDEMGKKAAEFVLIGQNINIQIPTKIILRNSL